jgi:hypothetical protein
MQLRLFLYPLLFKTNAAKHLAAGTWALSFSVALLPFITALLACCLFTGQNWPYYSTSKALCCFYTVCLLPLAFSLFLLNPKNTIMLPKPQRMVIYYNDVMALYGCSATTAGRKIQTLKDALGKKINQAVTIQEFCSYYGFDYAETLTFLKLTK